MPNSIQQLALGGISRHDDSPRFSPDQHRPSTVQPQPGLGQLFAVATLTLGHQQRPHLGFKRHLSFLRQAHGRLFGTRDDRHSPAEKA